MHLVINRLTFKPGTDWSELTRRVEELHALTCTAPGFVGLALARLSDTEGAVLVRFETREELDRISNEVAGPWFARNVRQFLAGPADRVVGEVVAGS